MMHECPKCGFVQPKDRYCANCGLDIEAYKPIPVPLWRRMLGSTAFQVGLAVGLILALGIAVIVKDQKALREEIQMTAASGNPEQAPSISEEIAEPDSPTETADTNSASAMAETAPAADATAAGQAAPSDSFLPNPPEPAPKAPKTLTVTFAQIPKTILQQLSGEAQLLADNGSMRTYLLPDTKGVSGLKEKDPDTASLPGEDTNTLKLNTPIALDFTHLSPADGADVGLNLQLSASAISEVSVSIEMSASLNLFDLAGKAIGGQQISADFDFSPKNTIMIVGVLPHQSIRAEDLDNFAGTPLSIYSSPEFVSGLTDFAILIHAK